MDFMPFYNIKRGGKIRGDTDFMKKGRKIMQCCFAVSILAIMVTLCILNISRFYDILMKTDLAVSGKDTGDGIAIEAIEGVANGDKGEYSGWIYNVNGEMPMDYCDKLEVNDRDEIVWTFSEGM